jgi:hypothetical protein
MHGVSLRVATRLRKGRGQLSVGREWNDGCAALQRSSGNSEQDEPGPGQLHLVEPLPE